MQKTTVLNTFVTMTDNDMGHRKQQNQRIIFLHVNFLYCITNLQCQQNDDDIVIMRQKI